MPALTKLSENTYLSAIRAGMVSIVPLTIIGGLFLVVSYLPVTWGSGKLSASDFKDLPSFSSELNQETNAVSVFLRQQLSAESTSILNQGHSSPSQLDQTLVKDLNAVILSPSLYNETRFSGVVLRDVTKQLLERNPQGKDLGRMNRLLVEDAYPLQIERKATSWDILVAPYLQLLQIPVTATFGLLALFACFFVAYDLGKQLKQEAIVSATMATAVFLMTQINLKDLTFNMDGLGSKGLFTAILIALITVRVQKFFNDKNFVIKMPDSVPAVVYESFVSLTPLFFLVVVFWLIRFVLGVDIDHLVQTAFKPLVFALNTLPGILVYAFLVTMLWSVGINGDNAMDALVAPIFLQYLALNVEAMTQHQPLPYITAYGFFTAFVNVGGTGATLALALVMLNSKEPGFRKVSRISLPTQIFQINEPIFFGFPIVLNPIFMIPYILNALILTTSSYLLMHWNLINKPFINVPWTTPPIIGHYLVSGGDWRAAVWGVISILIAMAVYYPFAKAAERQRIKANSLAHAVVSTAAVK
ncbi:MAG: PTS transporter subunit EIIC [Verrucomicrobiota bacterium]